ncbi:MAG TPA: ABC transporter ATP-binding protein [Planctomycetaceae bacterium]|nr:ABC transporter ATP-binding protein [Planctomycetaceae bacterium]
MTDFFRAVKIALRYRLNIAMILCSSLLIATLWGGNIGAIYPIIEVVFENKTLHEWSDDQLAELHTEQRASEAVIQEKEQQLSTVTGVEREELAHSIWYEQSQMDTRAHMIEWMNWVDRKLIVHAPTTPFRTLALVIAALLVGTIVKGMFIVLNMICVERLAQRVTLELRQSFYRQTLGMDLNAFGQDRTSGLMTRFTADVTTMGSGISTLFGNSIREPLKMIACLVFAALISWRLLLFSLIIAPIAIFIVGRLARSIKRANRRAMEEMTQLYTALAETFNGIQLVKAYTMEGHESSRFSRIATTYYRRAMRIVTYNALTRPATEVMGMLIICMAILAGGYLVLNNKRELFGIPMGATLSHGAMVTFFAMLIGASDPARKLAGVIQFLQASSAAAERVFEMMDRKSAIVESERPVELPDAGAEITFERIRFSYVPDNLVLQDVYLKIQSGESVAVVGANGCGKSTLLNLIPRFYDPVDGRVLLNGVDLRDLRLQDVRSQIGLVTQQALLFDDTIINNIRYGSLDATDEQVIAAARQANAHRFIMDDLEEGYETLVGEGGGRLSGGQRQRIALARAFLRDPKILILDEATSQVDVASEPLIHEALRQFIEGRTTIMITHRLSTLDLADRIVVMDEGHVADMGTHHELVQRCSVYQQLYSAGFREAA